MVSKERKIIEGHNLLGKSTLLRDLPLNSSDQYQTALSDQAFAP
jgi:hypothetical protein